MLDTNELLRISREFHREQMNIRGLNLRNDEPRKICYQAVDVNLGKVADIAGWFKYWQETLEVTKESKQAFLDSYVEGIDSLLWLAQTEQWMHLVVLEEAELTKLARFPHGNLNNHYLGLKSMLWNCYLRHSQDDYKHLWRSYLKLGLVEFELSTTDIMNTFRDKFSQKMTESVDFP